MYGFIIIFTCQYSYMHMYGYFLLVRFAFNIPQSCFPLRRPKLVSNFSKYLRGIKISITYAHRGLTEFRLERELVYKKMASRNEGMISSYSINIQLQMSRIS